MQPPLSRSLAPPESFPFTGPLSTAGRRLNLFALSLTKPDNRQAFLADEAAYLRRWDLTEEETALVTARDWTGLLHAGGHLHAILKIAATVGESLWHIGAHNAGVSVEEIIAACPRRVSGLPDGSPR